MDALLLVGGVFLMIVGCCIIAWAIGYSPEGSVRRRFEKSEKTMDPGLSKLIREYKETVLDAVEVLFTFWGLDTPKSGMGWACTDIRPQSGVIPGGIWYYKHGFGCQVKLPGRPSVDFDFTENGEIGISVGFLHDYMCDADIGFGIRSFDDLSDLIHDALASGDLDPSFLPRREGRMNLLSSEKLVE